MAPPVTIVSGLPRSGTSLMMQMLDAGGLPIMSDALRVPDEVDRVAKRLPGRAALDDGCEVEDRDGQHASNIPTMRHGSPA